MQSDAATPADYLKQLDDDWRARKLREIRDLILEHAPDLDEAIDYKMLGYGTGDNFVFHLNAQKNYVSFYVGDADAVDPTGALLEGIDVGKGCVRFKRTTDVPVERLATFITAAVARWRAVGTDC